MAKHAAETTGTTFPWQAVVRTLLEAVLSAAAAAPLVYLSITQQDPGAATGAAAVFLGVCAAITRVMNLPVVEAWLQRFLPWLAAAPGDLERKADLTARQQEDGTWDATPEGPTSG